MAFRSKLSPAKHGVAPGKVVKYVATIRNKAKLALPQVLDFQVLLPVGVTYWRSKNMPRSRYPGATGRRHLKASAGFFKKGPALQPVVDSVTHTVTWQDLTFPPRRGYKFVLQVRVAEDLASGTRLTFSASVYPSLSGTGQSTKSYNQTVSVGKKRGWGKHARL